MTNDRPLDEMTSAERLAMDDLMSGVCPACGGTGLHACLGPRRDDAVELNFDNLTTASWIYPDANPKAAIGATKVPLHLVPPSTRHFLALALEDGAKKYGPYNWRQSGISISTYIGAAARHLDAFWDGEDNATDSGVHHVAHALACCAILLDAMTTGKLVDDRPPVGAASLLQTAYVANRKETRNV